MKTWVYKYVLDENGNEVTEQVSDEEFEIRSKRHSEMLLVLQNFYKNTEGWQSGLLHRS